MRAAITIWGLAPNQIEIDLLGKADILDWHRGSRNEWGGLKLSSRRLLALLEHLPDKSAFKTAVERGGDWDEPTYMLARGVTLIDRLLAGYYAVHRSPDDDAEPYEPYVWRSPVQQRLAEQSEAVEDEQREQDDDVFAADMGWT